MLKQPMRRFGLIGKNLGHSFSKGYFEKKWAAAGLKDLAYEIYPLENKDSLQAFLSENNQITGLNVTIPYKQVILEFIDLISPEALEIGAVNCLYNENHQWVGYNTDGPAFLQTLTEFFGTRTITGVLILGTGGASKAVQWALKKLGLTYNLVSSSGNGLNYEELDLNWDDSWNLVINTSPVGMYPASDLCPAIPYHRLNANCLLYDLIYNPLETEFLKRGKLSGASVKNGLEMLYLQADMSWKIWNKDSK
ncbi:MAG: shikimate dehydrogenase [Saprospiraceae bacterium]